MHTSIRITLAGIILVLLSGQVSYAQKKHLNFRDSLDHQFDMSDFIINQKGFVPVPGIITEPALGGFGGALVPVFIEPNRPKEVDGRLYPMAPNITAVFGGYTLNDSWAIGAARTGLISKWGLKYALGGGYANINMDYYFNFDKLNNSTEFGFNIKTIPIMASLTKQLRDPRFSIGFRYLFTHNDISVSDDKGNSVWRAKLDSLVSDYISGNVAKLGLQASFDSRDNTFTPDKGFKINLSADWSHPWVGSDYKYGQFEGAVYYYLPLRHNLITGMRFDMQQVAGDVPFYIKPYIDMRGVPTARYAGKSTMLTEVEQRWDVVSRWSLLVFGGAGKAFDQYSEFKDAEWAWSYGTGVRYLIARKLKLRMGVDFAMGPEGFSYYIVFGSSWIRQ